MKKFISSIILLCGIFTLSACSDNPRYKTRYVSYQQPVVQNSTVVVRKYHPPTKRYSFRKSFRSNSVSRYRYSYKSKGRK